jgi:acetoin utilization deacetylase AcuC-like enzyme
LVFFQAGVDPLSSDRLGRLDISREGLKVRNDLVFDILDDADIPAVVVMGGGYSPDIEKTVACHADLYEAMLLRDAKRSH